MLKYDYIHQFLKRNFYHFGGIVALYPFHFVFIPLAIFFVLAVGFARLSVTNEVEYLYVPTNSRALKEREAVEKLFPPDKENFDILRISRWSPYGSVIVEAKDGGTIFRESIFKSIKQVDNIIKNITVVWKNKRFQYKDLCSLTADKKCFENEIFDLQPKLKEINKRSTCVKYPIHSEEGSFSAILYALWFGGVTTDENGCIQDVKAVRLMYYLNDTTPAIKEIALKWEEAFMHEIAKTDMEDIIIYRAFSSMLDKDGSKFTKLVIPVFYVALPIMLVFAVTSCVTSDWVTSKPWIGVSAFISPLSATIGAFGLLLLCGMEYPEFVISIPFLMLAIGLDDSFVLLSAWRRTDPENSVEQRMRETYSEAAVSITITSVTNLFSFFIGITTPYRVHQDFFIYGSLSVLMCYISEITFFGGVLALTGYREKKGLHALFFVPVQQINYGKCVKRKKQAVGLYMVDESRNEKELVTFYRDKLGLLLSKSWAKVAIIIVFLMYVSGGIYGIATSFKEGLNIRMVFPPTSYAFKYINKNYQYFSDYPHIIQIAIHGTLDYSNPLIQKDIEEIIDKFATAPKMGGKDIMASWLNSYLASTEDFRLFPSYRNYNISNQEDFISVLKLVFLKLSPFLQYNNDILFNENNTEIVASRFLMISKNITDGYEEANLISSLWKIADSCKYTVHIHNVRFVVQSLSVEMKDICIRTVLASTFLTMVIFVVTVPNLLCIILVGIAILSTEISVIGYIFLWNVGLDIVSSTALIITTGLSVDYLAHVSYAYIICQKNNLNDKLRDALHAAGHPVFQGCFSTILLVCAFLAADAYGFTVLFKIFLLLMLFAGFNSLTMLPVCLTLCETLLRFIQQDKLSDTRTINLSPESSSLVNSSKNGHSKTDNNSNV